MYIYLQAVGGDYPLPSPQAVSVPAVIVWCVSGAYDPGSGSGSVTRLTLGSVKRVISISCGWAVSCFIQCFNGPGRYRVQVRYVGGTLAPLQSFLVLKDADGRCTIS